MKTPWLLALAAVACAPLVARAADAPEPVELTAAERAYVAGQIHTSVTLYFAHGEAIPGFDLDEAFRAYLAEAMAAPDRRAFDLATHAFVARLRNGHSSFDDDGLGSPWDRPIGFRARPVGGEWVVTSSRLPALRVGDVVTAIDGAPLEQFYLRQRRYLAASSERAARLVLFRRVLFPLRFEVTLADGRGVRIDRAAQQLAPEAPERVEARWLEPGRVAYLRVPSWADPSFETEALKHLAEFQRASALLIDVRANGGGATPERLIVKLMDRAWRSWSESTPMTIALPRLYGELAKSGRVPEPAASVLSAVAPYGSPQLYWPSSPTAAEDGAYTGKLYLLVDGDCVSACEDFVAPFKDNRRATLVGETTHGSSGQPFVKDLPHGMRVRVGAKRERIPDGSPFEGVGIAPDVAVAPTAADLHAGRDPVLEAALRLARSGR